MKSRTLAALPLGAILLAASLAPAQPVPKPTPAKRTLADLAFLSGHWVEVTGRNLSEEIWTLPAGDSMAGVWRYVEEGRLRIVELLAIRQEAGGPVLRLRHFDPDLGAREEKGAPVTLPLVAAGKQSARFEGPAVGGAGMVSLAYRRDGEMLEVTLTTAGKSQEFRFRRMP
jgi:hypothetical protein